MLIWFSIGMTPKYSGIYRRGDRPVLASTALIDNHRFVSLESATKGSIPPHAGDFQEPQYRLSSFSITGAPKAIDWVVFADWFDLSVHWRGYTPVGALDEDWWHTLAEYITPAGAGYVVREKIVEWRSNRIQHLRRYINFLITELPIFVNHIPTPSMDDLTSLAAEHPSEVGAYHALAKSRAHFVDLAGFLCYCREAFAEFFEDGEIDGKFPMSAFWAPWMEQKKTGYILDLPTHWKTHNIPMWLSHNLPIHYSWSDSTISKERFARLDPEALQAHDEDVLGPFNPAEVVTVHFEVQTAEEYDEWLQILSPEGYNTPLPLFPEDEVQTTGIEFLFIDYEDWEPRTIDNALEASLLSALFLFKDKVERHTLKRTRRIFGYRPQKKDTLERISILLPYSTLNWPFSHRESFKFVYATPSSPSQRSSPVRSLLDRINMDPSTPGRTVVPRSSVSDDTGSTSSAARSAGRRTAPFVREYSATSRERSASPARSGRSNSSQHLGPLDQRRSNRRDDLRANRSQSSDVSMYTAMSNLTISIEGRARLESILPEGTDHFPSSLDSVGYWSAAFLQHAIITFQEPNSEWRIRAWKTMNPSWSATRLLNAALSFHIPFRLEIPSDSTGLFARQKAAYSASDLASSPFYSAGYRDTNIAFDPNGAGYAQQYLASLATLLMKPNAGAFLFEGGLLSRIAREFAPADLVDRAMKGPSAAVTLWSSSLRDNDRDTIREFVSPYEEQILIGESLLGGAQSEPHSIWPDPLTFATRFGPFQGIWNEACEAWFQARLRCIRANRPDAKTVGQWRAELRPTRRMATITDDTWRHIRQEMVAINGPSWNGAAVSTVLDLGAPGNQFSLPYAQ